MRFDTRTIGVFEVLSVQLVNEEVFDAGRLRQETLRLVEKGSRRIVVDLGGVDYLYSDSINALVALNRRMLESSGRMGILVPHPKVYDILVRAGLENIMRLYRSEAELQSDSRELMRQSSAWTRPAELLSAASASQVLSANVLSPKNPGELRDAASASQRVPRRRVGSRVELKPRRRGGRGMDQEQPTAEFQLPPILPALPGESTTLRTLSQDSSAFDQQAFLKGPKPGKAPKAPVQPRPEAPPQPAAEPTVFNVPENTRHDGYSTDAWLLSLTSPAQTQAATPEDIVSAAAAGSSSFLPKVNPSTGQNLQDAPSKFATEFAWDESEISLTESPAPKPGFSTPPQAPQFAPPPAAKESPWLSQPASAPAPTPPAAAPAAPPSQPPRSAATTSLPASAPSQASPYSSAFLDDSTPGSTVTNTSNPGPIASPRTSTPAPDPWLAPATARPAPQPDLQAAIFHDHPSTPMEPRKAAPAPASPAPAQIPPPPAPPANLAKSPTPPTSAESWFSGTATKPNQAAAPKAAASPEPIKASTAPSAKSGANSLEAWFGAGAANAATTPAKPAARNSAPGAASSASALDWVTPTKPAAEPAPPKTVEPPKPQAPAADPWIAPAPAAAPAVVAPKSAPAPKAQPSPLDSWITPVAVPESKSAPAPKAQPASIDNWITPAPAAKPVATEPSAPKAEPAPKAQPSPVDSWIASPPSAKAPASAPSTSKDAAIGGTAWLENTKPHRKPVVSAPKEPTSFLDLDDLEAQPSGKKPLWLALGGLALVAVIGLGISFLGGSKKSASDVPPSTTPIESVAPTPAENASVPTESVAPVESPDKPATPEPDTKSKAKSTKSDNRPESKAKEAASAEKAKSKDAAKPAAAAAPAPVPEEVHAPVKIFVTSRPSGAAVTLDGAKMGTTPCEITFKRSGKLEFSLAGYRKQTKDIDPEETRGTVNVQLSADGGNSGTGRIYISSAPVGAEIVVGGKVVGKTPKLIELPTGNQKVTVRSGVLSKTKSIDIQSGTNTAENFSL